MRMAQGDLSNTPKPSPHGESNDDTDSLHKHDTGRRGRVIILPDVAFQT